MDTHESLPVQAWEKPIQVLVYIILALIVASRGRSK